MPISKHTRKGKRKGQTGRGKSAQLDAINRELAATRRSQPDLADTMRSVGFSEEVIRDANL